ncbi:MAG: VWA domain-containing protein [Candidatus Lokiarchaeota archaeon]|nr:VWA domain-containing protein [Candidatus Lokiarchaeota archaeon]
MKYLFFNRRKRSSNQKNISFLVFVIAFVLIMTICLNGIATANMNAVNPSINQVISTSTWQNMNSPSGNYTIDYDTDNITAAEVSDLADVIEDAYDWLINDWNLPDPMTGSQEPPIEVTVVHNTGYNGKAIADMGPPYDNKFAMEFWPAYVNQGFPADHEPLKVVGHEHLHLCQYVHPGIPPHNWIMEGQARMTQDKLSNWLDDADGTEAGSSYLLQSGNYLEGSHTSDLTTLSYDACLFWNYLLEQYGDEKTDPAYGYDFITSFWDTSVNPNTADEITMLENTLNVKGDGRNFKETFEDFSVANYAKDLDDTTVPSEWKYVDDDSGTGANYATVSKEVEPTPTLISGGSETDPAESIERWASKYYEVNIDPGVEVITVQFNQSTTNELFYALLCVDGDDLEYYYTVESQDFHRAIVNNNYDKMVVIVVGLENDVTNPANYAYAIEAGTPNVVIEYPQPTPATAQARVGPHDSPEKFVAIVNTYYRKTAPVHGFFTENFEAQVGGVDATVLSASDVYGKYFLQIQAPNQAADGLYNLRVDLVDSDGNTIDHDTEEQCVNYNDTYWDCMLSIDRSGSMATANKILAAKSAAKLFVDSFLSDDLMGVVAFDTTASVIHQLMKLTTSNRNNALTLIDGITTGAATSVGDGLLNSQNELYIRGIEDNPDHIILLTDGKENTAPMIADVLSNIVNNETIVHVITIGADAAYEDMQELAADTGGMYYYCFDPSSGDVPNDLAEMYRGITDTIRHLERFYHDRGTITTGMSSKTFNLDVTNDMDVVNFVVHYNASAKPTVQLRDPSSSSISVNFTDDVSGMGHSVWTIENPDVGTWAITISLGGGSSDLKYFVEGAAHTFVTMELLNPPNGMISQGWGNCEHIGSTIPFVISLTDNKVISGANVSLRVTPPGYKTNGDIFEFPLFDDGNHGDALANDGIYGTVYTATSEVGGYQYILNATGVNNDGRPFNRIQTGAFYMYESREKPDWDDDDLPNNWEEFWGLDPNDNTGDNGKNGDPDKDGLQNFDEFYWGTDPLNSDTDKGGEGDGSEVNFGTNPHDPRDDSILKFPGVRVFPGNQYVFFRLPNVSQYISANLQIFRSSSPIFNLGSPIYNSVYPTTFNDTGLINYQTYYYRFKAELSGTQTGLTREYKVIPKENVIDPEAGVVINGGNKTTESNLVNVEICVFQNDFLNRSANEPTQMRISEDPTELKDLPWVTYIEKFPRVLSSGAGIKTLYVQIRDNQTVPEVSPVMTAGIYYTGTEDVGPETTLTLFIIFIDLLVISVIFYKKKNKKFNFKYL